MQPQPISAAKSGIVVAHGYGIKIRVEHRHLVVEDGFGRDRRTRRFHRASRRLRRLVLIGRDGYVTLGALRFLRDAKAALVHIETDGRIIATSIADGPDLAALRRAQALAATGPAGVEITRELLAAKVSGQRALLEELLGGRNSVELVELALGEIGRAHDLPGLLAAEARAASAYWDAWSELPMPFPAGEACKLPEHWLTFGQRASLLSGGPRLATNPANAVMNYLLALVEAETILACHAVGLDPGLGIFHADRRDRASLALDAMEAVRPTVDAYVLALLTQRTLSSREFVETREGSCRITPRLAASLAETCTAWREQVAPVVERIAHLLTEHAASPLPRLTPLTRTNWKAAWDERKPQRRHRQGAGSLLPLPVTCRDCGAALTDRRRPYCDQCRKRRFTEQGAEGRQNAARVLAQLRSEQRDPAHGGRAAEIRGRKNAAHQRAVRDWQEPQLDPPGVPGGDPAWHKGRVHRSTRNRNGAFQALLLTDPPREEGPHPGTGSH
jgi:CRISPR-associated endonuclease Cas1